MIKKEWLFSGMFCDEEILKNHRDLPYGCVEAKIFETLEDAKAYAEEFTKSVKPGSHFETGIEPISPVFVLDQGSIDLIEKITNRIETDEFNLEEIRQIKVLRNSIMKWNKEKADRDQKLLEGDLPF